MATGNNIKAGDGIIQLPRRDRGIIEERDPDNPGSLAVFDPSGEYRYLLIRSIRPGIDTRCLFIMCNPSKADAFRLDNTVSRCLEFARLWGFGWLDIVNIFALRSSDPRVLYSHDAPIGNANDAYIRNAIMSSDRVICAWGNNGSFMGRSEEVNALIRAAGVTSLCLGHTASGQPKHPLARGKAWIPYDAPLLPYDTR